MKPTVPPLFRKGYAPKLRSLRKNESVFLETKLANASRAALSALGAGKYRCVTEGTGTRVWRLG